MLELFPEGFEEVARGGRLEIAAYTDAAGAARIWRAFGEFTAADVAEDWAERWRRFHRPVRVGPLWIGPPWERAPADGLAVVIDPGRAFGTGAHETTRLCLELLLEVPRGSLVDAGCGSGILAIAAAKLGFEPVWAVDHDETAIEATLRNAAANDVAIYVAVADVLMEALPESEVAVANLSLAAVERLAARVRTRVLVASGYLASESPALAGYRVVERRTAGGWAADRCERAS